MLAMTNSNDPKRLRILVIDEYFPFPPNSGKPIRTWNLLKRLSERHDITVLCYGNALDTMVPLQDAPNLRAVFVGPLEITAGIPLYLGLALNAFSKYPYSVSKHYTSRFRKKLAELLRAGAFDLVQCEWTPYARYIGNLEKLPSVLTTHNVESQILFRRSETAKSHFARLFFSIQGRKMKRFERAAAERAAWVSTVSEEDAQQFVAWDVKNISVVDNGVDLDFYSPVANQENDLELLFLASLDWHPNIDALNFFLSEIFPLILRRQPNAKLTIAGRRPSPALREHIARQPNTDFAGEIQDVRPYLARASVVVVPLRIGGGSRLKILEAMAMGKAIISTSIGAEGLMIEKNRHLLAVDDPGEFANAVLDVLSSPSKRQQLGVNGRRLVEESYGWEQCAQKLEKVWYNALQKELPSHKERSVTASR
jgi:polysaccharide biosynthesis protein PslH